MTRRQPRPRARGRLDRRAAADRAGRLPRARAALRARRRRARSPRRSPAAPARRACSFAYPGIWLRDDVYAIHGHYADLHATVPTFERLAAGAMARWVVRLPEDGATPGRLRGGARADLRLDARAHPARRPRGHVRRRAAPPRAPGSRSPARAAASRPVRAAALGAGYARRGRRAQRRRPRPAGAQPLGPRAAPRLPARHRRGVARLGIGARHVIWGHSHRSGPWPADDPAEWTARDGARILNTGSWVYQRALPRPSSRTTRPTGRAPRSCSTTTAPPRLVRLLGERGHRGAGDPRA